MHSNFPPGRERLLKNRFGKKADHKAIHLDGRVHDTGFGKRNDTDGANGACATRRVRSAVQSCLAKTYLANVRLQNERSKSADRGGGSVRRTGNAREVGIRSERRRGLCCTRRSKCI